jgi:hypothetical protein
MKISQRYHASTNLPIAPPIGTGTDVERAMKRRDYGPPSFPRRRNLRLDGKAGKGEGRP